MAVVVSLINMKGGVGKTTIAAQLAHHADALGWNVLAVDLDPQSNLSQALLGHFRYRRHLETQKPTIDDVVRGYLPPTRKRGSPATVRGSDAILPGIGVRFGSVLDLLPSQLELAHTMKRSKIDPQSLARSIAEVADAYRLILIDCAPTESILTETAYYASRHVVVPVKPEYLATIGLPLLERSLKEYNGANRKQRISIAGIVINHTTYQSQPNPETEQSIREVRIEANKNKWRVFDTQIPYSRSWPRAIRSGNPIGRTKHARPNVRGSFGRFATECFAAVGLDGGK